MFKKIKFIVLALVTMLSISSCASFNTDKLLVEGLPQPGAIYNINEVRCDVETDFPNEVMVYKIVPYKYDEKELISITSSLNMEGEINTEDTFYYLRDDDRTFAIDKITGSYDYVTTQSTEDSTKAIDESKPNSYYIDIANTFIENANINEYRTFKEPTVYDFMKIEYIDQETQKMVTVTTQKAVQYLHKDLNGMEISGVAPRLTIAINSNGNIVNMLNPWGFYEEYNTYPIILLNEAVSIIANNDKSKSSILGASTDDSIIIDDAKLVYFSPADYEKSKYLVPYYLLEGINKDNEQISAFVCAVSDDNLSISEYKVNDTNIVREETESSPTDEEIDEKSNYSDPTTEQNAASKWN